jgi:hypothetical protein
MKEGRRGLQMRKKSVLLICLICFFFSLPLWAGEELMTKLFFDKWLNNAVRPLEVRIKELEKTYLGMAEQLEEIAAQVTTEIKVVINQQLAFIDGQAVELEAAPLIKDGRTMVPVRFIGEAFGANFLWEEKTRKVTYIYRDTLIEIFIDKKDAFINKEPITLDTAPFIVTGRTLVPLRFVSEHMGAFVDWDEQTRTVSIIK